jgi:hypothetical protein
MCRGMYTRHVGFGTWVVVPVPAQQSIAGLSAELYGPVNGKYPCELIGCRYMSMACAVSVGNSATAHAGYHSAAFCNSTMPDHSPVMVMS